MTRHRDEWRQQPRRCSVCGDLADHRRIRYRAVSSDGELYDVPGDWVCSDCDPITD